MRRKILLAPSLTAGHMLLDAMTAQGLGWINLRVSTPMHLARELVQPHMMQQQMHEASRGELRVLLEEELTRLEGRGELRYFAALRQSADLATLLLPSLLELRQAGVDARDLEPAQFVHPQKGKEIIALLMHLQSSLDSASLFDAAAMLRLGQSAHLPAGDTLMLIPANLSCSGEELAFINNLTARGMQTTILPCDPVHGLETPPWPFAADANSPPLTDSSYLSYLYNVEEAQAKPNLNKPPLSLFQAYGTYNEAREVLRRIKRDRISLDQVTVACTTVDSHVASFISLRDSLNVPITFGEGYSALHTAPGKLLQGLLDWVASDYLDTKLIRVLQCGALRIASASNCIRLLRRLGIGWGKDRYQKLQEHSSDSDPNAAADAEAKQWQQEFTLCVADMLSKLPDIASDDVLLSSLCEGFSAILKQYSRVRCETDGQAVNALVDELADLALMNISMPLATALERVGRVLADVRVGASSPTPGALHVASYTGAFWDSRPYTFVIGMDMGSFPGSGLQDPVLLDKERMAISPALTLRSHSPRENLYRLAQFLASRRGPLTLSFASFDTVEGRSSAPCSLFLQAFRLKAQRPSADYSQLLQDIGPPVAYQPDTGSLALSEDEWWLSHALTGQLKADTPAVLECYPALSAGALAEEKRSSELFTPYDGKTLPSVTVELVASATQLEYLAACPFAYLLRYGLKVHPVEETEQDLSRWLDAAQRGSLLHEIYCQYMRQVHANAGRQDRSLLQHIADEIIERYHQQLPAPNPLVYNYQRHEILNSLEVFWRIEAASTSQSVFFELPFGMGQDAVDKAGYGSANPIKLDVGRGRVILLKGVIDRVDRVADHCYEIWDFKTGSTYGYDIDFHLAAGMRLQHALYAWALEEYLQQSGIDPQARVVTSGYLFPTERGEGLRVPCRGQDRRKVAALLNTLFEMVNTGAFCATHDPKRCTFCDYGLVCGGTLATVRSKTKQDSELSAELAPWKELQRYE